MLLKVPADGVGAVVLAGVFQVLSDIEDCFDRALWHLSGVGVRAPGAWFECLVAACAIAVDKFADPAGADAKECGGIFMAHAGCEDGFDDDFVGSVFLAHALF